MPTVSIGLSISGGGLSINKTYTRSNDSAPPYEVTLPAAKTGTLSTRSTDTAGTLTMASGHGITDGQLIDIYWSGGVAYGATVGTVAGLSVPFTLASGDVLPAQSTAITAAVQVEIQTPLDGDNTDVVAISLETNSSVGKGHLDMQDSGDATIEEIDLVGNVPKLWDLAGGDTNAFTGNPITKTQASNGDSTAAATLKIITLVDATL